MNQKQIGIIIIIIGIVLAGVVLLLKNREDGLIYQYIDEKCTCYLTDGSCLHEDRNYVPYIIGWAISASMFLLGLYLAFVDKSNDLLAEQNIKVLEALRDAKKQEKEKDEFKAYLSGFSDEEQLIIKAIKEQEGIKQSTLRFRTGLSKTSLSLMLKNLEQRDIITKKPIGKTNQVFLKKKF